MVQRRGGPVQSEQSVGESSDSSLAPRFSLSLAHFAHLTHSARRLRLGCVSFSPTDPEPKATHIVQPCVDRVAESRGCLSSARVSIYSWITADRKVHWDRPAWPDFTHPAAAVNGSRSRPKNGLINNQQATPITYNQMQCNCES